MYDALNSFSDLQIGGETRILTSITVYIAATLLVAILVIAVCYVWKKSSITCKYFYSHFRKLVFGV